MSILEHSVRTEQDLPLQYPFALGDLGKLPPLIRWAQKHRPVCPVAMPSGDRVWMLTRKNDIAQVFADPRFSRNLEAPGTPRIAGDDLTTIGRGLFNLDPPDHTRVKQVVSPYFTRRATQKYLPLIQERAGALLEEMAAGPNPTDLVTAYAARLQLLVMREILGVPPELHDAHERLFPTCASITAGPEATGNETEEIKKFVEAVIKVRRNSPALDDPLGALLKAVDTGVITEEEMVGTAFVLFFTGSDAVVAPTTTGSMILMLHRKQLGECLSDPDLWPRAAEEVLRYYHNGVLGFPVVATEDVELHGQVIRRGEAVVASMQAATWDPAHVNNPEKFNIHRKADAAATFGAGPHYCLGSQFSRGYLQTALSTLFARFPTLYLAVDEHHVPWRNDVIFVRPVCLPVAW
ncbi:cytochrome P450 hydroxylase [Streptomyces avidinii]